MIGGLCVCQENWQVVTFKGTVFSQNQMSKCYIYPWHCNTWPGLKDIALKAVLYGLGIRFRKEKKNIYITQYASNFRCNGYIMYVCPLCAENLWNHVDLTGRSNLGFSNSPLYFLRIYRQLKSLTRVFGPDLLFCDGLRWILAPFVWRIETDSITRCNILTQGKQQVQGAGREWRVLLHCNENPIHIFLFWELPGLSTSFHIHASVSDLYILRIGPYIFLQPADRLWEYINRSQTHKCGNWDCRRAIPFLGIFV
jgi:hypothetical protein